MTLTEYNEAKRLSTMPLSFLKARAFNHARRGRRDAQAAWLAYRLGYERRIADELHAKAAAIGDALAESGFFDDAEGLKLTVGFQKIGVIRADNRIMRLAFGEYVRRLKRYCEDHKIRFKPEIL